MTLAYTQHILLGISDNFVYIFIACHSHKLKLWSFCVQSVEVKGDCLFCWYWWNCWP